MTPLRAEDNRKPLPDFSNTVVMTVDVEDYFMSPECIPFEAWPSFTPMIHQGMERVLKLLEEYQAKATFFFLGWLAGKYPELVHWTLQGGHEIATHTYNHNFVNTLTREQFDESLGRSLEILCDLAKDQPVDGHRAPGFSLDRTKSWQFEVLKKHGITYDSSINPHATYLYGDRSAPRFPFMLHGLLEIPIPVIEIAGVRMPVGGGGTLRILPDWYLRRARKRFQREGYPPVIYLHPWEFVPEHPKMVLPAKLNFIHWCGIKTVERKVRAILEGNRVISMREYIKSTNLSL